MKKLIALTLAVLLALSSLTALAEVYKDKPTVKAVQQALNDAGYNCGTPDGSAGKKTRAAIESYQADKGLEVTGQIDDALLEALGIATEEQADTEPGDTGEVASSDGENESKIDWDNPNAIGKLYNTILLENLASHGIDVKNEDIGQNAYMMSRVYPLAGVREGWQLLSDNDMVDLRWGFSDHPYMTFSMKSDGEASEDDHFPVNFIENAVIYTVTTLMNSYVGANEELLAFENEHLSAVPDRDDTVNLPLVYFESFGNCQVALLRDSTIYYEMEQVSSN